MQLLKKAVKSLN